MKKNNIFITIFIFSTISIFGQIFVNVKDYGALGNGIADDRPSIYNAFKYALENDINTVIFPNGTYLIKSKGNLSPDFYNEKRQFSTLHIIGYGNVRLVKDKSTAEYDFFFSLKDNIKLSKGIINLKIENITFDGGDKIAVGISVNCRGESDNAYFIMENCKFYNFRQVGSVSTSASAVSCSGNYKSVSIRDCVVENVSREDNKKYCSGIEISNLIGTAVVENCFVRGITIPNLGDTDADGVKIFGKIDSTNNLRYGKAVVRDCFFENCEGRAVKFQVTDCLADNNTVKHSSGKTITDYHSFDAQCGGGTLINNKVIIMKGVNLGSSAMPFIIQLANTQQMLYGVIKDNYLFTDVIVPYFTAVTHPVDSDAFMNIESNVVGVYSSGGQGTVSIFLKYLFNEEIDQKKLNLSILNNSINSTGQFLYFTKGKGKNKYSDMREKLTLKIINNENKNVDPKKVNSLVLNSGSIQINFLTLYNNNGWDTTWNGYLDATKIGDGSSVLYGTKAESGSFINGHQKELSGIKIEKNNNIIRYQDSSGSEVYQNSISDKGKLGGPWKRVNK